MKKLMAGLLLIAAPFLQAEEYRQIIKDEGLVYHVYEGPNGFLHAGVGHLLKPSDGYKLGDKITLSQASKWFWADYDEAVRVSERFLPQAPLEVRDVITNMAFNLGEPRLFKFVSLREALQEENWEKAVYEMRESLWFEDVGDRSKRLVNRLLSFGHAQRLKSESRGECGTDSGR